MGLGPNVWEDVFTFINLLTGEIMRTLLLLFGLPAFPK